MADPTIDRALAAALPTADRRSLRLIVDTVVARNRPEGLLGLVLAYHRLPPEVQAALVERVGQLFRPLREAMRTPLPGPINAIELIGGGLVTRLAYLLTEQLRHGSEEVRSQSAACLFHLAQQAVMPDGASQPRRIAPADLAFLLTAVQDAVAAYGQHRCVEPLIAYALLQPLPMPEAAAKLDDAQHPAVEAMSSLLRRSDEQTAPALLPMLARPNLAASAIAGLRALNAHGRLGTGVEAFHLLRLHAVRRGLSKAKTTAGLFPEPASLTAATPEQRRALLAFAAALPEDPSPRAARLLQLRKTSDNLTRLFALRRLIAMSLQTRDASIDEAIAELCHDADVSLARTAFWHLVRVHYAGLPKVLGALVTSRHAELRRVAGQRLAPLAFDRLWSSWPRLEHAQRLSAGRAIIKIDPMFHRPLGERLAAVDRDTRLRALAIIGELNQGAFYRDALLHLVRSNDPFIVSAAVRALGSANGEMVVKALEAALHHPDARVRANAIEALAQLRSTEHVDQLVKMVDDPQNRPRANAIAALLDLRTADAVASLRRMLDDQRPAHRHSALWLVETVGVLDLARHVAELSISDPDANVKRRANRVIEQLLALLTRQREAGSAEALAPVAAGGVA